MTPTETLSAALADRYLIERLLGEGGMATVYLARDLRHNRPVALKVLRPDLGAVVGVERFLAEIQVTANLQHPNLLPLFDSGAAGELLYYVMPYVPGESLRTRLDREKQLPVDEAVRLATAIGGALDYAHRQGVIHRDLKPENVLLLEGQPLVADFGIALAVSKAGGTRITQTGLSLGTPHYMSPEQATGDRVIDGRTDIYSLGALTYEMLTGEPPHVGSTSQAIIARVLTERPRPIRVSRPSVPEHVEAAVEHALEKLPADRWPSAREFAEALTGARPVTRASTATTVATPVAASSPAPWSKRLVRREAIAWGLAAASVAVSAWSMSRPGPVLAPTTRLAIELPDSVVVNGGNIAGLPSVALSRDGRTVAFVGTPGRGNNAPDVLRRRILYIRSIDDLEVRTLVGTEAASGPVFSPDGASLAYLDDMRGVRKISISGGTSQLLADSAGSLSWADDGTIFFTRAGGASLWAVSGGGGAPRLVVAIDTTRVDAINQIHVLPGSATAVARIRSEGRFFLGLIDLNDGSIVDLQLDGNSPRYVPPGFLLYHTMEGSVLSAVPFSPRRKSVTGPAIRITEGLATLNNGGGDYGVSDNGTIVFRWSTSMALAPTQLTTFDSRGKSLGVREDGQHYDQPRISPDGRHVVLRTGGSVYNAGDLWVLERSSGALTRLTSGNGSYRASWSRDGRRIFYMIGEPSNSRVMAKPWDGSGTDSLVLDRGGIAEFAEGPPGGWSALRSYASRDIMLVPTDSIGTATPRPFVTGPANETDMRLSPSGTLIAYQSDETGRAEVYVRSVPGPGPRVPVSIDGGFAPVWAPDGRTLYFRNNDRIMAATITESPLAVTRRDSLFTASLVPDGLNLDVLPGGRGFIGAVGQDQRQSPYRLGVISNWQSRLARPAGGTPR